MPRSSITALRRREQHVLQVGAVQHPERRAVGRFGVGERNAHDLAPRAGRHDANGVRRDGVGREAVAQSEIGQDARCVGGELQAGAGLEQLGRLFEDGDAQARLGHGQRGRQPRDPCAGDDDVTLGRHGVLRTVRLRR
jgi:hypothetical protein